MVKSFLTAAFFDGWATRLPISSSAYTGVHAIHAKIACYSVPVGPLPPLSPLTLYFIDTLLRDHFRPVETLALSILSSSQYFLHIGILFPSTMCSCCLTSSILTTSMLNITCLSVQDYDIVLSLLCLWLNRMRPAIICLVLSLILNIVRLDQGRLRNCQHHVGDSYRYRIQLTLFSLPLRSTEANLEGYLFWIVQNTIEECVDILHRVAAITKQCL